MPIQTINARQKQLTGNWSNFDKSKLVRGEIFIPNDHNPVAKTADDKIQEFALLQDMNTYEEKVEEANNAIASLEAAKETIITETKKYADQAKASATNASASASNAKTSEDNSALSKQEAQKYAEQAKSISESLSGALRPRGTINFADLPSTADATSGDMYNILDQFTTTTDFKEGSGNIIPAGSNVYLTVDRMWDVLAGTPVTGVKGNAETSYRRGNINITKANIGLDRVDNTADSDKIVADIDMPVGTEYISSIGTSDNGAVIPTYSRVEANSDGNRPSRGSIKSFITGLTVNILQPILSSLNIFVSKLGAQDISDIGDGSVTGAISSLNSNLDNISKYGYSTTGWTDVFKQIGAMNDIGVGMTNLHNAINTTYSSSGVYDVYANGPVLGVVLMRTSAEFYSGLIVFYREKAIAYSFARADGYFYARRI